MPNHLFRSESAEDRFDRAISWLSVKKRGEPVLVFGATLDSANEVCRELLKRHGGGTFGWVRSTLDLFAAQLAAPLLLSQGLRPASPLSLEAVCTRTVYKLLSYGNAHRLGRFHDVAHHPGFPRALSRTLKELRMCGLKSSEQLAPICPELSELYAAYEKELQAVGLCDPAIVFSAAARTLSEEPSRSSSEKLRPSAFSVLLLDVAVDSELVARFVASICEQAASVLATVPTGDELTLSHLSSILGCRPEPDEARAGGGAQNSLHRLRRELFSEGPVEAGKLDENVLILSAPGEARECVEIARRLYREAARGVPFDRMAVLLRAREGYRQHLQEAMRRAAIPAYFAEGLHRPDTAGRAFLALLACAAEGLCSKRFSEYLSLCEVPDRVVGGLPSAPPPPSSPDAEIEPSPAYRSPRYWEQLIIDAAILSGRERWESRLDRLASEFTLDLKAAQNPGDAGAERAKRNLATLSAFKAFVLPVLDALKNLPERAPWGEWLSHLKALAGQAIRHPDRIFEVLSELSPLGLVGPVSMGEVVIVLRKKLLEGPHNPTDKRFGRVFVASIEQARGLCFDVVFVPGLAEKMFPQKVMEDPLLSDQERRAITQMLAKPGEERLAGLPCNEERVHAERLMLRMAVGAAKGRVYLSFPRFDMEQARPRVPSFYGLEVLRAAEGRLPGFDELLRRAEICGDSRLGWPAPSKHEDAIDEAEHDLALLDKVFQTPEEQTVGTARYLLNANPHLARALRFRARRWLPTWTAADGLVRPVPEAQKVLLGHKFSVRSFSPTALQMFASCPYKFFLQAVHRLSPRRVPERIEEIDALSRGSMVHEVQFEALQEFRKQKILPVTRDNIEQAREIIDSVLSQVEARYRDNLAPSIMQIWNDTIAQVRGDLREWLRRSAEVPSEASWVPWRFELAFGLSDRRPRDPASKNTPAELDCGVMLRGSIDLVEQNASGALRATDYKTGKVRSKKGAVVGGGQTLQPLFYALALEKIFPDQRVHSGRLYYCTSAGGFESIPIELNDQARDYAKEVVSIIKESLENGFLPAAPEEGACSLCDYACVCGPHEEQRTKRKRPEALVKLSRLRGLP